MTRFQPFEESRLLIHIAFHYVPERIVYLKQVLEEVASYECRGTDVVIDTNSDELSSHDLHSMSSGSVNISYAVHGQLEHPFLLTWQHRVAMEAKLGDYDYFMYAEDDILIPRKALNRWRKESALLGKLDYLVGFIRVERDSNGKVLCTDQTRVARRRNLVRVGESLTIPSADQEKTLDLPATHVVQEGENLYRIGLTYDCPWVAIARANGIVNPNRIYAGQTLTIPSPEPLPSPTLPTTHTVRPGENLFRIGLHYGVPWPAIADANGITDPNRILVGAILTIPVVEK